MTLSDFTLPPDDLPPNLITPLPPKPELNVLVWSDFKVEALGGAEILQLPEQYLRRYHDHPVLGAQFSEWYADATKKHFLNASQEAAEIKQLEEPMAKRAKTEVDDAMQSIKTESAMTVVPNAMLPSPLIHKIIMPKKMLM